MYLGRKGKAGFGLIVCNVLSLEVFKTSWMCSEQPGGVEAVPAHGKGVVMR